MWTAPKYLEIVSFLAAAVVIPATAALALEGCQARLEISNSVVNETGRGQLGEITVDGAGGRYDRIGHENLALPLKLSASLGEDAGGRKFTGSELFLKAEGSGKDARALAALPDGAPVKRIEMHKPFAFQIQPQGPVAQNAISACNGLPASERASVHKVSMSVAVVWRVTTAKFNFKWTSYDQVAPSDDIQNNPDFYSGKESSEAEVSVDVAVACQPIAGAAVVAAQPSTTNASTGPVRKVSLNPVTDDAKSVAHTAPITPVAASPVTTASLADNGKPQCDGGMVRQVGSSDGGYLCLCPGNTKRVETSANAFACERGAGRR